MHAVALVVPAIRRSAFAAVCGGALIAVFVLALLGVPPAPWGTTSYSMAVLALLLGLAESHGHAARREAGVSAASEQTA
jgi:hypothetical protein